jgi:hypothetical protein
VTGTRRVEQLLWELRDGEIAAADRTWLEAELARDPEAAAMAGEVTAVHQALAEAAEVEAPAELGARIRRALERARPPRSGWSRLPRPAAGSEPTWRRGWAYLAAGLVMGIGLTLVLRTGPDLETRDVAGTAGLTAAAEIAGEPVGIAGGRGTLAVGRRGGDLTLRLEWTGAEPAELAVRGGGGLRVRSLEPPAGATLRELDGSVWVFRLAGPGTAALEATPLDPAAPIEVDVRAQGRSWARRTVRLEELP